MTQTAAQNQVATGRPARIIIPLWMRNPAGLVAILVLVAGVLGTVPMLAEIGRPFGGYASYGYLAYDQAHVTQQTPDWWPALAQGKLRYGDELLTIDGLPYTRHVWAAYARAYEEDRPVSLEVNRRADGLLLTEPIEPTLITFLDFLDLKLPELLVATVFWLLALLVLRARPDYITNRVFAIVAACVAIHRLTVDVSFATDYRLLVNLPITGHMIAAGLIGPLLMHLAYVFPTVLRPPRGVLGVAYALGLLSGVALAMTRLPIWANVGLRADYLIGQSAYLLMLSLLLIGIVALFGRLIWSWRHERDTERQERITRIILIGLLGALPAVAVVLAPLVPRLGILRTTFWSGFDVRYTMLTIPIAFAYVIIRYQTFKGISRLFVLVLVFAMSGMLAAFGAWLWRFGLPPEEAAQRPPFGMLFLFIFVGSAFWSNQAGAEGAFSRFLHRDRQSIDAVHGFGQDVMGKTNLLQELPQVMADALVGELALDRAAVWLWAGDEGAFVLRGSAGRSEPALPARLRTPAGAPSLPQAQRTHIPDLVPGWLRPIAGAVGIEAVVPLVDDGAPVGLLGLGRRWDEEVFDDRDLGVADLLGQQATLFVLAATQVEELRRVPDRVAEAQERERLRLAGELHDTIQQFLGRLPFFLAVSRDLARADPGKAAAILDSCLTDVEENAALLRGIRVNLAPNQLETSLSRPLHGLVAHVQQRWPNLDVELNAPPDLDAATTQETRHALYRVVQQALDNAVAHAGASRLRVSMEREDGRLLFAVRDDGRGSSEAERREAEAQGSFGLKSMQARLEMCGGSFGIESWPGQGTTVYGWVPAAENRLSDGA